MGGHNGGRPPALSDAMIATALEVARTGSLTLAQIGQCVQVIHAEPLPCQIETLGEALRRNTVNKIEFLLTFKSLQQQEELEGWQERKQRCPAGRGWRTL